MTCNYCKKEEVHHKECPMLAGRGERLIATGEHFDWATKYGFRQAETTPPDGALLAA